MSPFTACAFVLHSFILVYVYLVVFSYAQSHFEEIAKDDCFSFPSTLNIHVY